MLLMGNGKSKSNEHLSFRIVSPAGDHPSSQELPFDILDSGVIITSGFLIDYESERRLYSLTAIVSDGRMDSSPVPILICVDNVNDNRPEFQPKIMIVEVLENTVLHLADITAIDIDNMVTQLEYSLVSDITGFRLFKNGTLFVEMPLDFEHQSQHHMQIQCNDSVFLSEPLNLTVNVVNLNDHAPMFTQLQYEIQVLENEQSDTVLATIEAVDGDSANVEGPLPSFAIVERYEILENNVPFTITISPTTHVSYLKSSRSLDFESDQCSYNLTVIAYDGDGVRSTNEASISVTLQNENDNPILFSHNSLVFQISENYIGPIGQVKILDNDLNLTSDCEMNMMLQLPVFTVFGVTFGTQIASISQEGVLMLDYPLDYESSFIHTVIVQVHDGLFGNSTLVEIHVSDENEFCPELERSFGSIDLTLSESMPINTVVYRVNASDADGSAEYNTLVFELRYSSPVPFRIDQEGALITTETFDYESKQSFFPFIIVIHDNSSITAPDHGIICEGLQLDFEVVVSNENDERPYFLLQHHIFSVAESAEQNTVVGQLSVEDPDTETGSGVITFTVEPSTVPFNINPTGQILLTQTLDFEMQQEYSFEVYASDGIQTSEVAANITVRLVNVNEHSPEFVGPHDFQLQENSHGNIPIEVVDRDDGHLGVIERFAIINTEEDYFIITRDGFIRNSVLLDYERDPHVHFLTVCAFDVGGRNACDIFTISITDINDMPPQFTRSLYSVSVMEGSASSSPIHVMATDSDFTLEYRQIAFAWDSSSAHIATLYDITINHTSGVVTIGLIFDYETDPDEILLVVKASNPDGLFSTASVKVIIQDRNEFNPQFTQSHYNIPVSEATPIDYVLFTFIALDEDRGSLYGEVQNYRLSSSGSNTPLPFTISSEGYIVLTEKLKYHTGPREFNFSITATDGGGLHSPAASVTVTVQQSQNAPPIFQPDQYMVSIEENTIPDEPLVTLHVVTEAILTVFMIMQDSEFSDHFRVIDNGSLILVMPLDYEVITSITLRISVSDGTLDSFQPATVVVTVDAVNDNSPQFEVSHRAVQLKENLPHLSMAVSLTANDDDADDGHTRHGVVASYELLTESVPFMLVHTPGESATVITNTRPLDAEQDPAYYTLQVQAYDGEGATSMTPAEVIVQVVDVDDNIPQFEQNLYYATIKENYQGEVTVLTAIDLDRDTENRRISYTLTDIVEEKFQILSDGTIINRMTFDYEEDELYHMLHVVANDCHEPQCQTIVNVSLVDTNDNIPEFSSNNYLFNISDDIIPSIGHVVGSVVATDGDRSKRFGSVVEYSVRGSSGPFTVHSNRGDIVIHNPYELQQIEGIFTFEVRARDSGGKSDQTTVNIWVPLFNIYPPIFERRIYYTAWEENTFSMGLPGLTTNAILQVQAQDLDTHTGITYSLTEPSPYFNLLSSGILVLKEALNWEVNQEHRLFARAFDGKHNSTFDAEIRVNVIDQNDNSPQFNPEVYYMNISESFTVLTSPIGQVFAQDSDSPGMGYLHFFTTGPDPPIRVDSMGYIFLMKQLDFEQKSEYNITIGVSDGEHESMSPAQVIITVVDENDHYPYFPQPTYQDRFPENTPSGTLSLSISASDMDTSPTHSNIARYTIQEVGLPFEIRTDINGNAVISNSYSMDYETDRHVFLLHVHAYDNGGLRSMFPAQVTITLEDQNDCEPHFSQSQYQAIIRENNAISLYIATLLATDCDISLPFRGIRYSTNPQEVVHIDPVSGFVTAAKSFDFESEQSSYMIEVRAESYSNMSQYDTATLNIIITDSNEYNPEFLGLPYHVTVRESAELMRPIFQTQAFDQDGGDIYGVVTRYWMIQGSINHLPFRLNSSSGELFLLRALDYEHGDKRFDVPVVAMDGGSLLARTSIQVTILNENDEAPYFTGPHEHNISLPEEIFPIHLPGLPDNALVRVGAFDNDILEGSSLLFNLSSYDVFSIDSSGFLYLTTPLDYEEKKWYQVTIGLNDGLFLAKTTVLVHVFVENGNDHQPLFHGCLDGCCGTGELIPTMELDVDENLLPHNPLSSFSACDADGDALEYFILNSTHDGFEMMGSELYLLTELDYEEVPLIHIFIGCSDGKFSSTNAVRVDLEVNNLNDNILEFEPDYYETSVDENINPGDLQLPVLANDRDHPSLDILYTIPVMDGNEVPFQIVQIENAGHVVTNTEPLDFELGIVRWLFNITAQASSSVAVETAVATIEVKLLDLNEFAPEFSSPMYSNTFEENLIGVVAAVSAQDSDAGSIFGDVSYNIVSSPSLPCIINNVGEIMNDYPLDADVVSPVHHIVVEAIDGGGLKATAEVVIEVLDQNDNSPQFSRSVYTLTVPENTPVNTSLLELSANDLDYSEEFGTITDYQIMSSHFNLPFVMDLHGILSLAQALNFEVQSVYSLSITALDSGGRSSNSPATINIIIDDIPDEPPVFLMALYSATLAEGIPPGTIVARILAHSTDGGILHYSLVPLTVQPPFKIEPYSGVIIVNGSVDYEEQQSHELTISCHLSSSPGIYSTTSFVVHVTNINDHSPVMGQRTYHTTIMENSPHRTFALRISATDGDYGNTGAIADFQLLSSTTGFYVRDFDSNNGTAIISNYKSFDFEREQTITFHVIAIDRGSPTRVSEPAVIHINVIDINDNVPQFPQDVYSVAVPESTTGHVITVFATDKDKGVLSGAVVSYQLIPSSVPFSVSENGSISVSGSLDYDAFSANEAPLYEFAVLSLDYFGLSSEPAQVVVYILNENDNGPAPVYPSEWPVKSVQIEWGTPVSLSPVVSLNAVDRDREDSLFYLISDADLLPSTPLSLLHMASGDIILQRPLTSLTIYNLTITIQDRHPLLHSPETRSLLWTLAVTVVDTNSPPYFSSSKLPQILTVREGEPTDQTLLQVLAIDDDFPGSLFAEIIEYRIVSISSSLNGSVEVPFKVTISGELLQTNTLNVAISTHYAFGIVAVDGGGQMTPDPIAITVQIEESNDFAPVISIGGLSSFTVYDDTLPGEVILSVMVIDEDEGASGEFVCRFQEQSQLFEINPSSCDISIKSELNYSSLAVTNFSLTIIASDFGSPSLSDRLTISIEVIPTVVQELELRTNHTSVIYTEERGPVRVLDTFKLIQGTQNQPRYVATIDLAPGNTVTPDQFTTKCKAGGNQIQLQECFPGFTSCLPEVDEQFFTVETTIPPMPISIPLESEVIVFQTWIKTSHNRSESIVLISGYATTSDMDDNIFHIDLNQLSTGIRIGNIVSTGSLKLADNSWHHIFITIKPTAILLFVDGQKPVIWRSSQFNISGSMYLYVGRLKVGAYPEPFVGSMWGPSISFSEPTKEHILGYLFCAISCGESLLIRKADEGVSISMSSYELVIRTRSFQSLKNTLSGLSYNNTASEPAAHSREVSIFLTDGKYVTNVSVDVHTLLINEHSAVLDLRLQSSRNVFFYVEPSLGPYPTRTTPNAIFSDEDTSQTDYAIRIDIVPPPRRLCDRLDYAVKVKLQECGSTPELVMNFLPDYQWRLGTVIGVQSDYDYFLGYRYDGSGVYISDMSIYQNPMMDAFHFTFVSWLKLDRMGTVVHIADRLQPFLFWLRVNGTTIETVHSFFVGQRESLHWNWRPSEWVHVAVMVSAPQIQLCINGYDCQVKTVTLSTSHEMLVNNLDTHVGAFPDSGAYTDNFDGILNGVALIPNYTIPIATLNCLVACAEYILIRNFESSTDSALTVLTETTGTGILAMNGSLFVQESVTQDSIQDFLQNIAYINTHPYPLPGERQVLYSVKDGTSSTELLGSSSLVVLYHGYRNLQLLRILRVTITVGQLMRGVHPFESTGITTDARRDNMDSLMIELSSTPQDSSSCVLSRPVQSDCPHLLHLNPSFIHNSTVHIINKPNKIIVCGLSTVDHYQTLLRAVTVQWLNPNAIVTARSEFKLRAYISDMNGVSSTTKTLTVQVQGIARSQEEEEGYGEDEKEDYVEDNINEERNEESSLTSVTTESTVSSKLSGTEFGSGSRGNLTPSISVSMPIIFVSLISTIKGLLL